MFLLPSRYQVRGKDSEENPPKDSQQAVGPREQEKEERIHWRPGEQVLTDVLKQMKQKRMLRASNQRGKKSQSELMKFTATEHNPPGIIPGGSLQLCLTVGLRADLIKTCFFLHGSYGKFAFIGWRHAVHTTRSCRGKSSSWRNATCERIIYSVIFTHHTGPELELFTPLSPSSAPWWNNCVGSRRWSWTEPTNRPRLGPAFWWGLKEAILAHER